MNLKNILVKNTKILKGIIVCLIPIISAFVFLFHDKILSALRYFPKCRYYETLGIYCPGCGCTRSVVSLLHGNIISSIRNNPAIIFFSLILTLLYIELTASIFNLKLKLIPRGKWFIYLSMFLFLIFYVLRNFVKVLQPLSWKEVKTVFCKNCGSKLSEGALFCEECGAKAESDNTYNSTNNVGSSGFDQNYS